MNGQISRMFPICFFSLLFSCNGVFDYEKLNNEQSESVDYSPCTDPTLCCAKPVCNVISETEEFVCTCPNLWTCSDNLLSCQQPLLTPDGSGNWQCSWSETTYSCERPLGSNENLNAIGGGAWSCIQNESSLVCTALSVPNPTNNADGIMSTMKEDGWSCEIYDSSLLCTRKSSANDSSASGNQSNSSNTPTNDQETAPSVPPTNEQGPDPSNPTNSNNNLVLPFKGLGPNSCPVIENFVCESESFPGNFKTSEEGGCWFTGGGLFNQGTSRDTFGGNGMTMKDGSFKGVWQHIEHLYSNNLPTNVQNIFHGSVEYLECQNYPSLLGAGAPNVSSNFVLWRGHGRFNGVYGYSFEARAFDHGEGNGQRFIDRYSIVVKDSKGMIVFAANDKPATGCIGDENITSDLTWVKDLGCLAQGNIQIHPPNNGHPAL